MRAPIQNRRKRPLQVESLESLRLLSGLVTPLAVHGPAAVAAPTTTTVALSGTTAGTFYTTQSNPDTGKHYHISTVGKMTGTAGGPLVVSGDLVTPGNIRFGRTTGTFTVLTAKGDLTLQVTGPLQDSFAALPTRLGFTIVGGTGAYARAHTGAGTITLNSHVTGTTSGNSLSSFSLSGTITVDFTAGSSRV